MTLINSIDKIYRRKLFQVSVHILFWIVFFAVKLYITTVSFNVYRSFPFQHIILINLFSTFFIVFFYYILVYWLIPAKKFKRKGLVRWLGIPLLYILYVCLDSYSEVALIRSCKECLQSLSKDNIAYYQFLNTNISNITLKKLSSLGPAIMLVFVLCIPFCIKLMLQLFRNELKANQLAKDNLQLEFNFLKAQINPHFLFNTLNNIYGLILQEDNKRSAALVAQLSELLRYILYESDHQTMSVDREIKLLEDYTALEKVRLNNTMVSFNSNSDGSFKEVAPLLFMPLLENAFKYSADKPGSMINISIDIKDEVLLFNIKNSIDVNRTLNDLGGIGLNNFKKRLDLYYAEKYEYTAAIVEDSYIVNLIIKMS